MNDWFDIDGDGHVNDNDLYLTYEMMTDEETGQRRKRKRAPKFSGCGCGWLLVMIVVVYILVRIFAFNN